VDTTPMRIKTPKRPKRGSVIYIYIYISSLAGTISEENDP
jgi:hypothetical protein